MQSDKSHIFKLVNLDEVLLLHIILKHMFKTCVATSNYKYKFMFYVDVKQIYA
jgi:hypothetical protein